VGLTNGDRRETVYTKMPRDEKDFTEIPDHEAMEIHSIRQTRPRADTPFSLMPSEIDLADPSMDRPPTRSPDSGRRGRSDAMCFKGSAGNQFNPVPDQTQN
jgi:hypothetical protein